MATSMTNVSRVIKGVCQLSLPSSLRPATTLRSVTATRRLHVTPVCRDLDSDFVTAKDRLGTLTQDPGNQAKLQLYALFKQATIGKATGSRPGMMDFVKRAKWDAWNELGDISVDQAKQQYISTVDGLVGTPTSGSTADTGSTATDSASTDDVVLTRRGKYNVITLNRPDKKNALRMDMYGVIADMFEQIAKDDSTLTVLTGAGDFYCSGNDLSNFMAVDPSNIAAFAGKGGEILERFVGSFIDFPKPLIAVINGPAVGVSVTTLALCDMVYSTDRATFNTPFSALGQTPEGCSSYLFPQIMGQSKANEMLLFNRKLSASEACERGLVTKVFPDAGFQDTVWAEIEALAALPPQTLSFSKQLVRDNHRAALHAVNKAECTRLVERWQSDECINAIMAFFSRKAKM